MNISAVNQTLLLCEGVSVTGFTRGEGLQAIGLPNNASQADAKRAIDWLTKSFGGKSPSNEHSRAAYAQAWRAQTILRTRRST